MLNQVIKYKGTWSSLVYGTRLENENFKKVVSSNLTVPVKNIKNIKNIKKNIKKKYKKYQKY